MIHRLRSLKKRSQSKRRQGALGRRPCIEPLEDRNLLAVFNLLPGVADGAAGSLRDAITTANSNDEDDVINLAAGTYSLSLLGAGEDANATGDLDVGADDASGSAHTVEIVGSGTAVIDASSASDRVLHVLAGADLSITSVTVQGGRAVDGTAGADGADNPAGSGGDGDPGTDGTDAGGILNAGVLLLDQAVLQDNRAGRGGDGGHGGDGSTTGGYSGGGGGGGRGGGLFNLGQATIIDSRLVDNHGGAGGAGGAGGTSGTGFTPSGGDGGEGGAGGGVFNGGTLIVSGTLFESNIAGTGGAGGRGDDGTDGGDGGEAGSGGEGGAISGERFASASTTISNSDFHLNQGGTGGKSGDAGDGAVEGGFADRGGAGGSGGAISNYDILEITDTIFRDNTGGVGGAGGNGGNGGTGDGGSGGDGGGGGSTGAIQNSDGNVTLTRVVVQDNLGGAPGAVGTGGTGVNDGFDGFDGNIGSVGGVFSQGGLSADMAELTITDSTFERNIGRFAGAVLNSSGVGTSSAVLTIDNSVFRENEGALFAGGVTNDAGTGSSLSVAIIRDSLFQQNVGGSGGGIYNTAGTGNSLATMDILRTTVIDNEATIRGGGVALSAGTLEARAEMTITDSLISGNDAPTGGGLFNNVGIAEATTDLLVQGSTISDNTATTGGGFATNADFTFLSSAVRFVNSTLSGNSADEGGGVYLDEPAFATSARYRVFMTNTTIADNTAAVAGGGLHADNTPAMANLKNTLIVGNTSPLGTDVLGNVISEDNNLVGDGTGSTGFTGAGDLVGTAGSPIAAASVIDLNLADNGGLTPTHALIPFGPAIDAGGDADTANHVIPSVDQRGQARPVDGDVDTVAVVDIGAFEFINGGPTAVADSAAGFVTDADTVITTASVLTNDTDPNPGDVLSVTNLDTTGTIGQVTDNGDGTFQYDPDGQFLSLGTGQTALDTFAYTITDLFGETSTATVTIQIEGVNDGPTANDDTFAVDENSPTGTSVGTVSASDPDIGDSLTFSITAGNPNNAFDINGATGQITVDNSAELDFETTPTFVLTVEVADTSGATDTATITINLNDVVEGSGSGVFLIDGILTIIGTPGNDTASVTRGFFTITVTSDFFPTTTFNLADIDSIEVLAGDGDDNISLGFLVFQDAVIDGGAGNDTIAGGWGDDVIFGGPGNDDLSGGPGDDLIRGGSGADQLSGGTGDDRLAGGRGNDVISGGFGDDALHGGRGADQLNGGFGADILLGARGTDTLNGGSGRDLLIGGLGADTLLGGSSDDIMIGGRTAHDNNLAALNAILTIWNLNAGYFARVSAIRNGSGPVLNGVALQAGVTVFNDGVSDTITGGTGRDWYFAELGGSALDDDDLTDRAFNEFIDLV